MAKVVYKFGNILDDDADAIVVPVNTVGVMGKGLAKEFADLYPVSKAAYRRFCNDNTLRIGSVVFTQEYHAKTKCIFFPFFFPTKGHWLEKSSLTDIAMSFGYLARVLLNSRSLTTLAIPALGCGLGGLDWQDVEPLLLQFASLLHETFTVRLYAPQ